MPDWIPNGILVYREGDTEGGATVATVRSRAQIHGMLVGIAVGVLTTGLILPFVVVGSTPDGVVAGNAPDDGSPLVGIGDEPRTNEMTPAVPGSGAVSADEQASTPVASSPVAGHTTSRAPSTLTATDRGVTATTVTLGFPLYDLGAASRLGLAVDGLDPEAQQATIQAFVDHVNDEGGINGRRIRPVYRSLEVLSQDAAYAVCLALTEDESSFAVLGDLIYPGASQCVTNHDTILLTNSAAVTDDSYAGGKGLLYGMFPRGSRMMANFAAKLGQLGKLNGTKVGILSDKGFDPAGRTMAALVTSVQDRGGTVVRATNLSEDRSVASSQVPVEVNQMRSAGAEAMLFISGFLYSTQFAQQADSQRWVPAYFASDWAGMYVSNVNENMPPSYDGALVVTTTRDSDHNFGIEPPPAARCREIYEQRAGTKLGTGDHDYAMVQCDLVLSFVHATRLAGPNLTRASAGRSLQRMGPFPTAFWGGGTFGPGKFDMADQIQVDRWDRACKCFEPHSPFEPSRY